MEDDEESVSPLPSKQMKITTTNSFLHTAVSYYLSSPCHTMLTLGGCSLTGLCSFHVWKLLSPEKLFFTLPLFQSSFGTELSYASCAAFRSQNSPLLAGCVFAFDFLVLGEAFST